jgi:hypothetical protein
MMYKRIEAVSSTIAKNWRIWVIIWIGVFVGFMFFGWMMIDTDAIWIMPGTLFFVGMSAVAKYAPDTPYGESVYDRIFTEDI